MKRDEQIIPIERISSKIYLIRREKILLDFDLHNCMAFKLNTLFKLLKET